MNQRLRTVFLSLLVKLDQRQVVPKDMFHAAIMDRHEIREILTFDTAFDLLPGIDRIG